MIPQDGITQSMLILQSNGFRFTRINDSPLKETYSVGSKYCPSLFQLSLVRKGIARPPSSVIVTEVIEDNVNGNVFRVCDITGFRITLPHGRIHRQLWSANSSSHEYSINIQKLIHLNHLNRRWWGRGGRRRNILVHVYLIR